MFSVYLHMVLIITFRFQIKQSFNPLIKCGCHIKTFTYQMLAYHEGIGCAVRQIQLKEKC